MPFPFAFARLNALQAAVRHSYKGYSVLSLVILDADEDWFPFACYADVFFLEYLDTLLC
jgi:hypothetical protein